MLTSAVLFKVFLGTAAMSGVEIEGGCFSNQSAAELAQRMLILELLFSLLSGYCTFF